MAFKMGYNKEELSGVPPAPSGRYTLQLKGFKPKINKKGTADESYSYNAELSIINSPNGDCDNRRVFVGLNSKMAFMYNDFVHAMGLQMEEIQNGNEGTEKALYILPGVWEGSDTNPEEPEKWKYLGPMTNKTMEVELAEIPAQTGADGKMYRAKNEVRQFLCAISGCTEKHSTNLIRNTV